MDSKEIATYFYNYCLDMDGNDYIETMDEDIEALTKELDIIKEQNLTNIENLIEALMNSHGWF